MQSGRPAYDGLLVVQYVYFSFFFFQAEDGIRDRTVTGVQTCALPIWCLEEPGGRATRPPAGEAPARRTWVTGRRSEERREGKSVDLGGRGIIKKKRKETRWRNTDSREEIDGGSKLSRESYTVDQRMTM